MKQTSGLSEYIPGQIYRLLFTLRYSLFAVLLCLPLLCRAGDDNIPTPTSDEPAPGDTITLIDARGQVYRVPTSAIILTQAGNNKPVGVSVAPSNIDELVEGRGILKRKSVDRGIRRTTFIPKGTWMGGGTLSFSDYDNDNLNILVLKDIEGDGYSVSVSPFAGYFFRNDMMIGLRLGYSRSHFDLESFELNLGEDFNISLDNLYWLEQTYEAAGIFRTYMPIGQSRIFGLFNEVRLTYAYSSGKNSTGSGTEYDGTYQKAHSINLGIAPGLTAFVTNRSAVEVSLGVMGYGMKWVDQKTNQVESGSKRSLSGNFKINLFSINIGMTFYL